MSPEKIYNICKYGLLISGILTTIFLFGLRHYGNVVSELKSYQQNKELKEEIVKEIKNAFIEGSPELVNKITKNQEWNFEQGTFEYILREDILFKNKRISLTVSSIDKSKMLKIYKDEHDFIKVIYQAPEIGSITRGTQIKEDDIGNLAGKKGVYIAFSWDLKKQKTTLYINGKVRDDLISHP